MSSRSPSSSTPRRRPDAPACATQPALALSSSPRPCRPSGWPMPFHVYSPAQACLPGIPTVPCALGSLLVQTAPYDNNENRGATRLREGRTCIAQRRHEHELVPGGPAHQTHHARPGPCRALCAHSTDFLRFLMPSTARRLPARCHMNPLVSLMSLISLAPPRLDLPQPELICCPAAWPISVSTYVPCMYCLGPRSSGTGSTTTATTPL